MSLEYTVRGKVTWEANNLSKVDLPNTQNCVDTQYSSGNENSENDPCQLFLYSLSTAHMFAFIEICTQKK